MRVSKVAKGTYYDVNTSYYQSSNKMKRGIAFCIFTGLAIVMCRILFESINDSLISSTSDLLSGGSGNFFANLSYSLGRNETVGIILEIVKTIVQFFTALFVLIISLINSAKSYLGFIGSGISL